MRKKTKRIIGYAVIATIIVALTFLGAFVEKTPLYERAIVLSMALDKGDAGVKLSIQTIVNGNNTSPGSASAYDVVEGEGKNLSDALDAVAKKSGLKPSYAHCELIIVGGDFFEEGFDEAAKVLFEKTVVQDNVHVIATEGKAADMIKSRVPVVSTPSEYVTNDLKIYADEGSSCVVTLKDYVQRLYDGGTKILTCAVKEKANPPTSSETGEQKGEFFFFDLDNVAVKDKDGNLHFYGKEISYGRNLVESKKGQALNYTDGDKQVTASVISKTQTTKYSKDSSIATSMIYYVKVDESTGFDDDPKELADFLQRKISFSIKNAYEVCARDNADVFSLESAYLKRYGTALSFKDINWSLIVKVTIR